MLLRLYFPAMRIPPLALFLLIGAACAKPAPNWASASHIERSTRGDTTIVRTTGVGAWGPMQDAVEERRGRSGGTVAEFGRIGSGAVLPSGAVAVFDGAATDGPTLKLFDANGSFVKTIGRTGEGPGEYRSVPFAFGSSDGTIILWDYANRRIDRYTADGGILPAIPFQSPAGGAGAFVQPGLKGSVYVLTVIPQPRMKTVRFNELVGYVHFDTTGRVLDTILSPHLWFTVDPATDYEPNEYWTVLSDGRVLGMRTDHLGFLLKPLQSTGLLLRAEVVAEPPRFDPVERRELQAFEDYWDSGAGREGDEPHPRPIVPEIKPNFTRFHIDIDGRIWLRRNVRSVSSPPHTPIPGPRNKPPPPMLTFADPVVWSAFDPDGTYLGDIRFPLGTRVLGFTRDIAWGVVKDQDDQESLVKFKMPPVR